MVNIWLDDVRPAPDGWIWAKTASECISCLVYYAGEVDILCLDHDLGTKETGYDVALAMYYDFSLFPRRIYLHTSNPVGRENMYQLLNKCIVDDELDSKVYRGPHIPSWEVSMEKSKEMGYF